MLKITKKCMLIAPLLFTSQTVLSETWGAPGPAEVEAGKVLYEQYCLSCHQKDGVGEQPIPKHIRLPGYLTAMPLNETSHAWHHTDEQIANTIMNGLKHAPRMPAWKSVLTEKQAVHLVAYIKSLWSDRVLACQGPKHMTCM